MARRKMQPVEEVDIESVKYKPHKVDAPYLAGYSLKLATWLAESYVFGGLIISTMLRKNKYTEKLSETVIPESPMFLPQFPSQDLEPAVKVISEDSSPVERVKLALECLPNFEASSDSPDIPFRYWRIRDYANAYHNRSTTPTEIANRLITFIEDSKRCDPPLSLFISFNSEDIRRQAAEATRRFETGCPLSELDGIFMAVKDEIDCIPYDTRGGTTWFHEVREVRRDAVCVARLRECGVIFIGKTNQHELGSGTSGMNPHYGTARNPHDPKRYPGGSSAGSAALVACGLCPVALGTDGGGSVRIPSALCGILGLKTTHGRTTTEGVLELGWTVEVVSPMAGNLEDMLIVYAAMLGSGPNDAAAVKPNIPSFPILFDTHDTSISEVIGSITLGKYAEWFNDSSPEVVEACEKALQLLAKEYSIKMKGIILPELEEMRIGHVVTIGSEIAYATNTHYEAGKRKEISYDIRSTLAMMRAFSSRDYVAAQSLRRRSMFYHMKTFESVDVIVSPTTGMTAPVIPKSALKIGESNLVLAGSLMRFVVAPNFLGFPAITVPVGYDKDGLPIGLQLIGKPWAEATLLRLAYVIEKLVASERRKPAVYYDVFKSQ